MSRAIDADALIDGYKHMGYDPNEHPEESYMEGWCKGFNAAVDHCIGHVIHAPTIEPEQRWIPCSERLPENEYVLISKKPTKISGSKWSVNIAIRTADPRSRKIQWRDIGFGVIQDDKVLAWMPLPEPYRGD